MSRFECYYCAKRTYRDVEFCLDCENDGKSMFDYKKKKLREEMFNKSKEVLKEMNMTESEIALHRHLVELENIINERDMHILTLQNMLMAKLS